MGKLEEALKDCFIDFDQRIRITDLLGKYELNYKEAASTVQQYIEEQEKRGTKYEKRFLVRGKQSTEGKEIYTVVNGEKLQEWLDKLNNAESTLYSVEVAGGAKSLPAEFIPLERCAREVPAMEFRAVGSKPNGHENGVGVMPIKAEPKSMPKKATGIAAFIKKTTDASSSSARVNDVAVKTTKADTKTPEVESKKPSVENKKSPTEVNKNSVESKKKTPPEDKKSVVKAANQKGIGSFFAAAKENSKASSTVKPLPTPKKVDNFFKKQPEKPPAKTNKPDANKSVQLFDDDDDDEKQSANESESSDEEEKLEAIKRKIITSDHEDDAEEEASTSHAAKSKRRRIEDSDDEEPQQKNEKKEEEQDNSMVLSDEEAPASKSETFLDEDGYVMTIKSKKKPVARKPATTKVTPPANKKAEPTITNSAKSKATAATKSKQGNIMSFFSKK